MQRIILRGGLSIEDPLAVAVEFLHAYSIEAGDSSGAALFAESDLRRANRGGARISAVEIAAILERRRRIERALGAIPADTSLAGASRSIPWAALTRLFEAFAGIRGVGFSKMTKALHPKRPALIPMLDSAVQAYLAKNDPVRPAGDSFAEHATALVRSYKRDLDRNRLVLRALKRELGHRGFRVSEVRILDVLIWSAA